VKNVMVVEFSGFSDPDAMFDLVVTVVGLFADNGITCDGMGIYEPMTLPLSDGSGLRPKLGLEPYLVVWNIDWPGEFELADVGLLLGENVEEASVSHARLYNFES